MFYKKSSKQEFKYKGKLESKQTEKEILGTRFPRENFAYEPFHP